MERANAWLKVLRDLGAEQPTMPVFRALTTKGNLANRTRATMRGVRMKGGALDERIQQLVLRAGVPYTSTASS